MKQMIPFLIGALALMGGCSQHQQAEAGSAFQKAEKDTKRTLRAAGAGLGDTEITMKVKGVMLVSSKLNTSGIHVKTHNHVVYLNGSVTDYHQKALAGQIALDTVGADVRVVNDLEVGPVHKGAHPTHHPFLPR